MEGFAETRLAIALIRTLARLGRWADRRNVELRLRVNVAPDQEWPDDDVLFVLHAHNEGAKPVTVERMGVLSLDRLHHGEGLGPHRRVMEASWTKPLPKPTPLERGRGGAEIRFSAEELAHQGLSFQRDMLACIAMSSDGRLWFDRVRDRFLWAQSPLRERLDAAERRGQASPGAKRFASPIVIFSVGGRVKAERQMRRLVRQASLERRGVRAR